MSKPTQSEVDSAKNILRIALMVIFMVVWILLLLGVLFNPDLWDKLAYVLAVVAGGVAIVTVLLLVAGTVLAIVILIQAKIYGVADESESGQ